MAESESAAARDLGVALLAMLERPELQFALELVAAVSRNPARCAEAVARICSTIAIPEVGADLLVALAPPEAQGVGIVPAVGDRLPNDPELPALVARLTQAAKTAAEKGPGWWRRRDRKELPLDFDPPGDAGDGLSVVAQLLEDADASPREYDVAMALVASDCETVASAAVAIGMDPETARTHLRRLRKKFL